jgi:hypothetical protein
MRQITQFVPFGADPPAEIRRADIAAWRLDRRQAMLDLFSIPPEALWLAVALVAVMAGMLAAAPE